MAPARSNTRRRLGSVAVRTATAAALALLPCSGDAAARRTTALRAHHPAPLSPWEKAELARGVFERSTPSTRTRAGYDAVMDRFRLIYHENPRDPNAPEAINAVAELLAEAGRDLHDPRSSRAAIGQYEFLRTQYPGTPLRVQALLAEAQIEANDLHDPKSARERYQLLLTSYPHSSLAEQARAGEAALSARPEGLRAQPESTHTSDDLTRSREESGRSQAQSARDDERSLPSSSTRDDQRSTQARADARSTQTASAQDELRPAQELAGSHEAVRTSGDLAGLPPALGAVYHRGPAVTVTGIRHWSTPTYTRVAIDLTGEVEYEAARVPSPDRIFFDLHGTHLAPDLIGKSFSVTDDGFLKRIRVAQSSPGVTRVVLDVNDVTEYSAFLLPNPFRLIVDIHGTTTGRPHAAAVTVEAPAPHAATVPNTRAVRSLSSADVRNLSNQPGKVEATPAPTSQPIATVVSPRSGEGDLSRTSVTHTSASEARSIRTDSRTPVAEAGLPSAAEPHTSTADSAVVGVPYSATLSPPAPLNRRSNRHKPATAADAEVVGVPAAPARAAARTADGQTSLVRALGLKINRIVIDAGHGGHDSGTIGPGGLEEKDVVLDVALRLGRLLHDRLGADVIYTRSDDTFIPLETRTAIANKAQADLFLSIHANSSPDPSARGVETYYLNFTEQADALQVAARENAVSGQSIHQLSDLVRKITLTDKLAESREFAADVQSSLYGGLARGNQGLKNRGVKKAPFVVLIGANMPSVLAEISFVTNPRDAVELRQPEYRERIAESLYRGVARYVDSLSSVTPVPTERASTGR